MIMVHARLGEGEVLPLSSAHLTDRLGVLTAHWPTRGVGLHVEYGDDRRHVWPWAVNARAEGIVQCHVEEKDEEWRVNEENEGCIVVVGVVACATANCYHVANCQPNER